ncbi:MAG: hypothetical protein AUK44_02365 [Porphyromonadaceae bacterium CG2_30_38_12]|nr:MAG: hypothetical protein AUK44_02365 [Porphyromonadaceae bacterium CG2_30_38_12]
MRILICPLNWGLGHATRCVPIIHRHIAAGDEVVIASDGYPAAFLKQTFPALKFFELPSYGVRYSSGKSQTFAMLANFPRILKGIYTEHKWLKNLLQTEMFDIVISDNRFGLWNKAVESVYITHQLMIKMPLGLKFLEPLVWLIHRFFISRYHQCWIPDMESPDNFSGDLSHAYPLPMNARFIGILSRFEGLQHTKPNNEYHTVAVVSGLEPQRTLFLNSLIKEFENNPSKTLILSGQPRKQNEMTEIKAIINITIVSHLEDKALAAVLLGASLIISRSGYSSIMDYLTLNVLHKVKLVPTPGQTEQMYLFQKYFSKTVGH